MTLREMLLIIRRRWLALAICVVLGIGAAFVYTAIVGRQYTSVAHVLVTTPGVQQNALVPPGGISAAQQAVNFASIVTGDALTQQVVDQLHLKVTRTQLQQQVKATVVLGTTIVEISVKNSSPAQAQRVAQEFATDMVANAAQVAKGEASGESFATLTITDPASLPQTADAPGRAARIAFGFAAGVIVGLVLVWLLEYFDSSIRRPEDMEELTDAPVLGTVAPARGGSGGPAGSEPTSEGAAEQYRTIRTSLQFAELPEAGAIVTVSGVAVGVGASAVARGIAASVGAAGRRVLLIDVDLRRPSVAHALGLPADHPGLGDVLSGAADLSRAVQQVPAGPVDVLAAGKPPLDPTEQVQGGAMRALLAEARSRYDVILLDAPPVLAVNDAALLSTMSDGTVLVAKHAHSKGDVIAAAARRISSARARLLGSVVTAVPVRR